jgi:hypothetical protein
MKKIKIVGSDASKQASQKKTAIEPGDIAPVLLENFETLTNPPFKPRLELIEADPHNPPDMNAQTDQNINTEGDDPNRPDAGEIASKAPEYEKANGIEVEKVPHENEHVKQGELEEQMREMKATFSNKFARATRLFDIRLAAGVEQEINRNSFVHSTADDANVSVEQLEQKIAEEEEYLKQIQASQQNTPTTTVPKIASGFTGGARKKDSVFEDDLEMIIYGGA